MFREIQSQSQVNQGLLIAEQYNNGLSGWAGEALARRDFHLIAPHLKSFDFNVVRNSAGKKVFLHQATRKLLGKDTPNYPQEIGDPFIPGTKVLMDDGSEKNIEDIQIGETVINHKNEKAKVTNVIKKKFTGKLVTLKVKGWHRTVTATESHHGLVLPYSGYRFSYDGYEPRKFGEMNVGDYVLLPYGCQQNEAIILDLSKEIVNDRFDDKFLYIKNKKVNRYIAVNSDFARFIGLFLAEGSSNSQGISFSFNSKETYINEVLALGKEILGLEGSIWKTGNVNCTRVAFNCNNIGEFFKKFCGSHTHNKFINNVFFRTGNVVKLALLRGWLDGDGFKNFKKNAVIGYTTSNQLGDDFSRLAISCGLNPRSWKRLRKTRVKKENTELAFYGTEPYKVYENQLVTIKPKIITQNNTPYGFARPIEDISYEDVVDYDVYCITTENEFTAIFNGIASRQCVSFATKNGCEYLSCCDIILRGDREKFRFHFPPWYYGASRVLIGGWDNDFGDGSLVSYAAKAVMKYGCLFNDEPNVPKYSGSVAKQWGAKRNLLTPWQPTTQKYLVKSAALVSTWEEFVAAISNGYPIITGSNVGYAMKASSDGFHRQQGSWSHALTFIGVDDRANDPYALILNSWGDVHGELKDFDSDEILPVGVLRVRKADAMKHVAAGETFALSQFDGFPETGIDKLLFKLV